MNHEQTQISQIQQSIARFDERLNAACKQIEENQVMVSQMHRMTVSIENLTIQVKDQNDNIKAVCASVDEKIAMESQKNEERFKVHGERIGCLETKPAKRGLFIIDHIKLVLITAIITAIITSFLTYFGL